MGDPGAEGTRPAETPGAAEQEKPPPPPPPMEERPVPPPPPPKAEEDSSRSPAFTSTGLAIPKMPPGMRPLRPRENRTLVRGGLAIFVRGPMEGVVGVLEGVSQMPAELARGALYQVWNIRCVDGSRYATSALNLELIGHRNVPPQPPPPPAASSDSADAGSSQAIVLYKPPGPASSDSPDDRSSLAIVPYKSPEFEVVPDEDEDVMI